MFDHDTAIAGARFEIAVIGDFLNHVCQVELCGSASIHSAIDPCQRQQLIDQRIQPARFQPDPLEIFRN